MPWSNNGTVQVSSGGTIATGTGTTFLSSARVGDAITIAGSTSLHEVTAIASNTQLTFQPPYTGTTGSGKAYRIAPIMGYDKDLSDAFNSIRLQWGTQLSSLQPWATAATADIALSNLGGSQTGTAVFKGSPAAGRTALELGNAATRAVQTSPTDTTAGALMAVGAFGLGLPISLVRTDINSVSTAGFFTCDECTGTPSGYISGMLLSHSDGPVVRMQIFNPCGTGKLFFRDYLYGWGAWRELYHQNNILGTVSQSGGIPAGAIIERGSNANGEFVKFADGTQICTTTGDFPAAAINTPLAISKPHPAAFISINSVQHSVFSQIGHGAQDGAGSVYMNGMHTSLTSTTTLGVGCYTYREALNEPVRLYFTTHGRWY